MLTACPMIDSTAALRGRQGERFDTAIETMPLGALTGQVEAQRHLASVELFVRRRESLAQELLSRAVCARRGAGQALALRRGMAK